MAGCGRSRQAVPVGAPGARPPDAHKGSRAVATATVAEAQGTGPARGSPDARRSPRDGEQGRSWGRDTAETLVGAWLPQHSLRTACRFLAGGRGQRQGFQTERPSREGACCPAPQPRGAAGGQRPCRLRCSPRPGQGYTENHGATSSQHVFILNTHTGFVSYSQVFECSP